MLKSLEGYDAKNLLELTVGGGKYRRYARQI